jgi:hypothetical protein
MNWPACSIGRTWWAAQGILQDQRLQTTYRVQCPDTAQMAEAPGLGTSRLDAVLRLLEHGWASTRIGGMSRTPATRDRLAGPGRHASGPRWIVSGGGL